ncbi:hypothetical protein SLA2020_444330 [Shorea laevis]
MLGIGRNSPQIQNRKNFCFDGAGVVGAKEQRRLIHIHFLARPRGKFMKALQDAVGFRSCSFSKNQNIICIQKMRNWRTVPDILIP